LANDFSGKRVDLKTGFVCNNNCVFCAQAHKKHLGNKTTEQIKIEINASAKRCDNIVFTGGEATIRKDIIELVKYAKEQGYSKIQLQSNCRMLSYMPFVVKLIKAGVNIFNPAVHGYNANTHDSLTRTKGSFDQTIKAIKNLRSLSKDLCILTNTVVVKQNYLYLEEIANLLIDLKVNQFQFAFVHPIGNALENFEKVVPRIKDLIPYVHKGLKAGISAGVPCFAEALPYCHMQGFEDCISDRFEPVTEIQDHDIFILTYKEVRQRDDKLKSKKCKKCKYNEQCEGTWKEYIEFYGDEELKPC